MPEVLVGKISEEVLFQVKNEKNERIQIKLVENNGFCGVVDYEGNIIIPFEYESISLIDENTAIVEKIDTSLHNMEEKNIDEDDIILVEGLFDFAKQKEILNCQYSYIEVIEDQLDKNTGIYLVLNYNKELQMLSCEEIYKISDEMKIGGFLFDSRKNKRLLDFQGFKSFQIDSENLIIKNEVDNNIYNFDGELIAKNIVKIENCFNEDKNLVSFINGENGQNIYDKKTGKFVFDWNDCILNKQIRCIDNIYISTKNKIRGAEAEIQVYNAFTKKIVSYSGLKSQISCSLFESSYGGVFKLETNLGIILTNFDNFTINNVKKYYAFDDFLVYDDGDLHCVDFNLNPLDLENNKIEKIIGERFLIINSSNNSKKIFDLKTNYSEIIQNIKNVTREINGYIEIEKEDGYNLLDEDLIEQFMDSYQEIHTLDKIQKLNVNSDKMNDIKQFALVKDSDSKGVYNFKNGDFDYLDDAEFFVNYQISSNKFSKNIVENNSLLIESENNDLRLTNLLDRKVMANQFESIKILDSKIAILKKNNLYYLIQLEPYKIVKSECQSILISADLQTITCIYETHVEELSTTDMTKPINTYNVKVDISEEELKENYTYKNGVYYKKDDLHIIEANEKQKKIGNMI